MNPNQHGEVFVTNDGAETDLDLGHYERFTGVPATRFDNITAGKVYQQVIKNERKGIYLGNTVQVIPHVTDEIKKNIGKGINNTDFLIVEVGGTVGDIESLPFLEAIRQLRNELGKKKTAFIHVTLVPYLSAADEQKTKPTQHSVKELREIGIQPDILVCRCERDISRNDKNKIALFCNIDSKNIIQAIKSAKEIGCFSLAILGHDGGEAIKISDFSIHFPSWDMQLCEDFHLSFGHLVMKSICSESIKPLYE